MKTYIALFRGINVGGRNILSMQDLVGLLEGMGFERVKTYIQSGNAVFQSKKKLNNKIAGEIGSKILKSHGIETKTLLFEITELQDAVENNPFKTEDAKALHYYFLESQPKDPDLNRLMTAKSKSEKFKLNNKIFYLYAPDGIGRSKLAANVEQSMGVPVTARNQNTVNKLIRIATQD